MHARNQHWSDLNHAPKDIHKSILLQQCRCRRICAEKIYLANTAWGLGHVVCVHHVVLPARIFCEKYLWVPIYERSASTFKWYKSKIWRWASTSQLRMFVPHLVHIGQQTEEKWWWGVAPIVKHTHVSWAIFSFSVLNAELCVTSRQLHPNNEEDEEAIRKANADQPVHEKWWQAFFSINSLIPSLSLIVWKFMHKRTNIFMKIIIHFLNNSVHNWLAYSYRRRPCEQIPFCSAIHWSCQDPVQEWWYWLLRWWLWLRRWKIGKWKIWACEM